MQINKITSLFLVTRITPKALPRDCPSECARALSTGSLQAIGVSQGCKGLPLNQYWDLKTLVFPYYRRHREEGSSVCVVLNHAGHIVYREFGSSSLVQQSGFFMGPRGRIKGFLALLYFLTIYTPLGPFEKFWVKTVVFLSSPAKYNSNSLSVSTQLPRRCQDKGATSSQKAGVHSTVL